MKDRKHAAAVNLGNKVQCNPSFEALPLFWIWKKILERVFSSFFSSTLSKMRSEPFCTRSAITNPHRWDLPEPADAPLHYRLCKRSEMLQKSYAICELQSLFACLGHLPKNPPLSLSHPSGVCIMARTNEMSKAMIEDSAVLNQSCSALAACIREKNRI